VQLKLLSQGSVVTFYFTTKQNAQILSAKDEIIASKDHEIGQIVATHERALRMNRRLRMPRRVRRPPPPDDVRVNMQ
jgi:hypothetical protein